jgi:hypothetical protein
MEMALNKTLLAASLGLAALLPLHVLADSARPIENKVYLLEDQYEWKEGTMTLPPYPSQPDWAGFFVPLKPGYHYFVDAKTLNLSEQDNVLRFTLRAVSPSGAENLSFEGIHCAKRTVRSYAFGDSTNHRWIESTRVIWKPLGVDDHVRTRLIDDICPGRDTPLNTEAALQRLKKAPWF